MLTEGVGGNGRDSCFSGLSFRSAIYPPRSLCRAPLGSAAGVAVTYRLIVRLGRQFRHQNDEGDKRCEETRSKSDHIPLTGAVVVSSKPLARLDLSLSLPVAARGRRVASALTGRSDRGARGGRPGAIVWAPAVRRLQIDPPAHPSLWNWAARSNGLKLLPCTQTPANQCLFIR
jgi:hypothetical protein